MKKFMFGAFKNIFGTKDKIEIASVDEKNFDFFCNIVFLKNIPRDHLRELYGITKEIKLAKGEYLFHEGDTSSEFFIVIEGSVEVTKLDAKHEKKHHLTTLSPGQTVGEMAVIDHEPRSASVHATMPTRLIKVPFVALDALAAKRNAFTQIYHQISKNVSQRLRYTNEVTIRILEKQLEEFRLRVLMGRFMVNVIIVMCLFTFALAGLQYLVKQAAAQTFVTILLMVVFVAAFGLLVRVSGLPKADFGITLQNWRLAVWESVLCSLLVMAVLVFLKWCQIHFLPEFAGHPLFEPFISVKDSSHHVLGITGTWGVTLALYWFLVAPTQELIARGGLQGSLETFLVGKYKTLTAILVSNLLFSTVHLYLSIHLAIIVFIPGIMWGWLYSRHRTLVGVTVSHILLGTWAFWIVGIFV